MLAHAVVYAPIGQASRSEQIIDRLSNAIVTGLLEAEEQLPNEAELSRMMGVSPVTVREALNTLRVRGLIDTRRGRNGGSFVCHIPAQALLDRHPLHLASSDYLADLGELHLAMIGHCARLAAQRSTPHELQGLAQQIKIFASTDQADMRAQADMRCLLMLATNAQSSRLANQELAIQAEWAPLIAAIYHDADIHAEITGHYQSLLSALEQADEAGSCTMAQHMIATLTDHMFACKLRMATAAAASATAIQVGGQLADKYRP